MEKGSRGRERCQWKEKSTLSLCPSAHLKCIIFRSVWLCFCILKTLTPPLAIDPLIHLFCGFLNPPFSAVPFPFLSPFCKLLTYWQLLTFLGLRLPSFFFITLYIVLLPLVSHSVSVFVIPYLSFFHYYLSFHHLYIYSTFSISCFQLYDLGSPADSQSSSPGCLTTDSSCVNMGYPSCGHRGRCHGEWGSFSCQCVPGYTGQQCEEGKATGLFIKGCYKPSYQQLNQIQRVPSKENLLLI